MKQILIVLSFLVMINDLRADDCMSYYANVAEKRQEKNELKAFGAVALGGAITVVTGGLTSPLLVGAYFWSMTQKGPQNTKFSGLYDVLRAAKHQHLRRSEFKKFRKQVNKELLKLGQPKAHAEEIADILNDGNRSQKICPEYVNYEMGDVSRAIFDREALKNFVLEELSR